MDHTNAPNVPSVAPRPDSTNPTSPLTSQQLVQLRYALVEERERLYQRAVGLALENRALGESQGEESSAGGVMADVASDASEQELALTLERTERRRWEEIDAALGRMDHGEFGVCESCGQPIGVERLNALPWTRYCVRCSARHRAESAS